MLKEILEELKSDTLNVHGNKFTFNYNKTDKEWNERIRDRVGLSNEDFKDLIERALNSIKPTKFDKSQDNCVIFFKSRFILVVNYSNKYIVTIRDMNWDNAISKTKECSRLVHNIVEYELQEEYVNYYVEHYGHSMDTPLESMYFEKVPDTKDDYLMRIEYNCSCIKVDF